MKIGIMTFHASNNCGSMLQAYALQNVLKNHFNLESDIINFSNKQQQDMYALFRKIDSIKDLNINIVTLLFNNKFKRHYNDYKSFSNNYFKLSGPIIETNNQLVELSKNYNVFICGSDQIWNICCNDADDAYFLNFCNNVKKIAYAPSFGSTNIIQKASDIEKYKKYFNDFDYLSCREKNGSKWLEELTNKKVPVLFDPTLLLNSEDWNNNFDIDVDNSEKYIFYYAFKYSNEVNAKVKQISKELGMPVYIMDMKWWLKSGLKYGFKITKNSGPIEFLRRVKNASLVLTTSFHGTAFSIIFRKKFWFLNSSMHNKYDDRAITLLESVGLSDRMIDLDKINLDIVFNEINYKECTEKISKQQEIAIDYLKKGLNK